MNSLGDFMFRKLLTKLLVPLFSTYMRDSLRWYAEDRERLRTELVILNRQLDESRADRIELEKIIREQVQQPKGS